MGSFKRRKRVRLEALTLCVSVGFVQILLIILTDLCTRCKSYTKEVGRFHEPFHFTEEIGQVFVYEMRLLVFGISGADEPPLQRTCSKLHCFS